MDRVKGDGSLRAKEIAIVAVITGSASKASRGRESSVFRRKPEVGL
jgi:hypothetical protein